MKLTFSEMYNAIGKQGAPYEGVFITAVKSTKIFCRPTCRARKPLAKNVVFFGSVGEALKAGFRPCKVCRPMEMAGETPAYIKELIEKIGREPYQKIKDQDLREMGLEPSRLRRWFKSHHNMSFHAYQRLIRLNSAFVQIQKGRKVVDSAFDSGFESLSAFNDGYKAIFGDAPTKTKNKTVIYIDRFPTVLGPMYVCATAKGVCLLEFTDRRMLEAEFRDLRRRTGGVIIPGTNVHIKLAQNEIRKYFAGELREFSVTLDLQGTDFQKRVWAALLAIPYGQTRSYAGLAELLGFRARGSRAVANANGMNKVCIIVPCHRVIGSDGSLTGYAGGLARKRWLLEMESTHSR